MVVCAAGYEHRTINEFVGCLKEHRVRVLVDVRELPLSRKKGFSKSQIHERLEHEGIEYVHLRVLGSPRQIRHQLRESGDYASFFREYRAHLRQHPEAIEQLRDAMDLGLACLMCYEEEPRKCHRSIILDELSDGDSPVEVCHL